MAFVINDKVKETTTTTGTGTINLDGASQDFISFVAGVGTTNQTFYAIVGTGTGQFEVGIGTVLMLLQIHFLEQLCCLILQVTHRK